MRLCLGTVQLGLQYGIKGNERPNFDKSISILKTAACKGVTMLDTAPSYGGAESVIGRFFEMYPEWNDKMSVVTKLPSFSGVARNAIYDKALASLQGSLRELRADSVDGVLLHDECDIMNTEVMEVLLELKKIGLTKNIGVSVYNPGKAIYAAMHEAVEYIQVPYNALDRRLDETDFFMTAKRNNKTVFARSVFLQGLLTMDVIPVKGAADYVQRFRDICLKHGMTPARGCVSYAAANNGIDYLIMGIDNTEEINENIHALNSPVNSAFIDKVKSDIQCFDDNVLIPSLWRKEE